MIVISLVLDRSGSVCGIIFGEILLYCLVMYYCCDVILYICCDDGFVCFRGLCISIVV